MYLLLHTTIFLQKVSYKTRVNKTHDKLKPTYKYRNIYMLFLCFVPSNPTFLNIHKYNNINNAIRLKKVEVHGMFTFQLVRYF